MMKYDLTEFEKLIDLLAEAGIPYTKEKVFTEKNPAAKAMQNRIFFWYKPENRSWAKVIFKKYGERYPQR